MNLYSFFRKKHRVPFLGAIFAVVFLSAFFVTKTQTQASLSDYETLFSGKSPAPLLTLKKLVTPIAPGNTTTLKNDVKFNFQGSFPFLENSGSHEKKWYWDHIRDFFVSGVLSNSGSKYVFMLRICEANATVEGACVFSIVPHQTEMSDDESIFCPTGKSSCKLPGPSDPTSKIYHYTATINNSNIGVRYWLNHSDVQNDKFNVTFDVTDLALLADGKLDTPIPSKDFFKIGDSTYYKADIWYCAGKRDGETLPTVDDPSKSNIRQFKNLCGDNRPYFKIAESKQFKMPQTVPEALGQTEETIGQVDTTPTDSNAGRTLPVCSVINGALGNSGTFMGCIAYIGYGIYNITAWIATVLGKAMDFFLGYSISDESYRVSVVVTGWKLVRDISNIFFIIILVWTGFATVFNLSSVSMKKVVPALIINALLINFSLFGTQVIIDISNITARLFYNTMSVCDGKCRYKEPPNEKELDNPSNETIGGYKLLSVKIVDSFDPQKIFKPGTLSNKPVETVDSKGGFNASGISNNIEASKSLGIYDSDYAIYFLIVSIIAAFIMLGMAKMFFGVMFMFVGRVVGLYMSMIFSPFAVLTRGNMPLVSNIKELSWSNWLSELTKYALLAPIFVFFLYIIYAFINSDLLSIIGLKEGDSFMSTVMAIIIPMIIVYMLIAQGVEIAKKYAGTAGNMIQKFASQATGIVGGAAVGVAAGGLALVGRGGARIAGAYGKGGERKELDADGKEITTTRATRWAASANKGAFARLRNNAFSASQTSSFDVRNAGIKIGGKEYTAGTTLNSGLGKLGINMKDQLSGAVGLGQTKALGKDGKPGGNIMIDKKRAETIQKELENNVKMSHLSDDEAKAAWEKYKTDKIKKYGQEEWEKQVENLDEVKVLKDKVSAAETKLKEAEATGGVTLPQKLEIARAKEELETAKSGVEQGKMAIMKNIKDGKDNASKTKAIELSTEEEAARLRNYGNIKDNKTFVTAMRAEYAQGLDKKALDGLGALKSGIFAGIITGMIPGLSVMSGLIGGSIVGGLGDSITGARAKAIKDIIDKANKTSGKGNPVANLEARVSKHEDEMLKAVNEALEKEGKGKDTYSKFSDIGEEELEDGLVTMEAHLQEAIDAAEKKLETLKGDANKEERIKELKNLQKSRNQKDALRNSIKNRDKAKQDLDALKEKEKEKADKEAEKNKPKDK